MSIHILRPYQEKLKKNIEQAWSHGATNVLAVMPTGSGKTVVFSDILMHHDGPSCAIAHRQELVSQISLALNKNGVKHNILAPPKVVRLCVKLHMEECNTSTYDPHATCTVAGVDTLIRRANDLKKWAESITLWVQDESHHLLRKNKWGKVVELFTNSKGLGVTATPTRADGRGLGRHADGVFDELIVGETMRNLIDSGNLTDYRIYCPPTKFNRPEKVGSTGDFSGKAMTTAFKSSKIVGDVVEHYIKLAHGKRGITFTPSIESAEEIAQQFVAKGVPAAAISSKTSDSDRYELLRKFKKGDILQLVNVDIFGEGFDLPAIEVASFARPTESYALYVQQFGRALRPLAGKNKAIIIDHVGNVHRHLLPDSPREWSLDSAEKKQQKNTQSPQIKTCLECFRVYERIKKSCPFCGHHTPPQQRSTPEQVDGDLTELDPQQLDLLRKKIEKVDKTPDKLETELISKGCPKIGIAAHVKRHKLTQEAQKELRKNIAIWATKQRHAGKIDAESYMFFYQKYGVDVLTAQSLNRKEADKLSKRIYNDIF